MDKPSFVCGNTLQPHQRFICGVCAAFDLHHRPICPKCFEGTLEHEPPTNAREEGGPRGHRWFCLECETVFEDDNPAFRSVREYEDAFAEHLALIATASPEKHRSVARRIVENIARMGSAEARDEARAAARTA